RERRLPGPRRADSGRALFPEKSQAALAQLVEHIIRNDGVACSSHASGTILACSQSGGLAKPGIHVVYCNLPLPDRSFVARSAAMSVDPHATKIVSSPQIVPTISAMSDWSSATPMRWAEPGGVLITTRLAAVSIDRAYSRRSADKAGPAGPWTCSGKA